MAQAVLEEGDPLELYLRDAGDLQLMPGISLLIVQEIDDTQHLDEDDYPEDYFDMEWRPRCLVVGLNLLESFLSSTRPPSPPSPLVERFKYTVISSSLLSTSLASHQSKPPRSSFSGSESVSLPGKLHEPANKPHTDPIDYTYFSIAALATAVLVSFGKRWLSTLSLGGLSLFAYNLFVTSDTPSYDFTPTINALDELVEANRIWESTVQDAFQMLEKEEATLLRSPSSTPLSSTNALRVSLNSTLQTTRTQCDNVRQLFDALTSPSELSQLSEMYAPPSPVKSPLFLPSASSVGMSSAPPNSAFGHGYEGLTSPRPHSYPLRGPQALTHGYTSPTTPDTHDTVANKRATWSGSTFTGYTGLANAGSPTNSMLRRRERRHSNRGNVSALFSAQGLGQDRGLNTPSTASVGGNTPITPSLGQIAEDLHLGLEASSQDEHEHDREHDDGQVLVYREHDNDQDHEVFGAFAADLEKEGKEDDDDGPAFELARSVPASKRSKQIHGTPPRPANPTSLTSTPLLRASATLTAHPHTSPTPSGRQQHQHHHRFSTFASSSRFTTIQPPRHPLSLYALTQSLQACLSSRRYTCSHLIALKFSSHATLHPISHFPFPFMFPSFGSNGSGGEDPDFGSSIHGGGGAAEEYEREVEEYWENVKSVVELLTSTFGDEAARLGEALEDVERQYLRESNPTPDLSGEFGGRVLGAEGYSREASPFGSGSLEHAAGLDGFGDVGLGLGMGTSTGTSTRRKGRTASYERVSFAPMPSHLSRFAAHVAAISAALEDAREQLEECVAALKEDVVVGAGTSTSTSTGGVLENGMTPVPMRQRSGLGRALGVGRLFHPDAALQQSDRHFGGELEREEEEHRALQAYERLRRELGVALRECERGRQRLIEIVAPVVDDHDGEEEGEGEGEGDVPGLANDASDDSAEEGRVEPLSPPEDGAALSDEHAQLIMSAVKPSDAALDEVTAHLLASMQERLEVGVEQVYEADTMSSSGVFGREKSKLSREERIRIAKAKRESLVKGSGLLASTSVSGLESGSGEGAGGKMEKWGPGGEVVQELKDVIWKVSEKRRKMRERLSLAGESGGASVDGKEAEKEGQEGAVQLSLLPSS